MVEQLQSVTDDDRLKDPLGDRVLPTSVLPLPPQRPLSWERGFPDDSGVPNTSLIAQYMHQQGKLSKELVLELFSKAAAILSGEPNLLRIDGKVVIVGDIHG